MANTCCNRINFCSTNLAELNRLHASMIGVDSYYSLFVKNGYSEEEARKLVDVRDTISRCDSEVSNGESYYYFSVDTETAWEPNMECLFKLLDDKYSEEISMYYISEEPGNGVFVTNDEDNLFFNDRYVVDCWETPNIADGTKYFSNKKELVKYIKDTFDLVVSITDSHKKIEKKIDEAFPVDEFGYCTINKFEIE